MVIFCIYFSYEHKATFVINLQLKQMPYRECLTKCKIFPSSNDRSKSNNTVKIINLLHNMVQFN